MITKIQKWGNSQGLRLSKELLSELDINVGDEVEVSTRHGALIIKPSRRYDLDELLSDIPDDYTATEMDWGKPSGKEVW